ncbi:MAG: hypothetical protein CLLPBCKN_003573 [Chroococcidiopsis cubana SAG 39.79]|nr:hypothetical protein [Chroococcidiopsis cubana SAG 39.79]
MTRATGAREFLKRSSPSSIRLSTRIQAPAWSELPLSVPEVRRLLWRLFWQWIPLLLIFSIGLIGGGDIKRLLSFIITNVAFPNRSAIYNCSIRTYL